MKGGEIKNLKEIEISVESMIIVVIGFNSDIQPPVKLIFIPIGLCVEGMEKNNANMSEVVLIPSFWRSLR